MDTTIKTALVSINGECVTVSLKKSGRCVMHTHRDSREYDVKDITDPHTRMKVIDVVTQMCKLKTMPSVDNSITKWDEFIF